jgi:hypothetical protein
MCKQGTIPGNCYIKMDRAYRFDLAKVEQALLDQPKELPENGQLEFDFDNDN